jgi:hypothetical protein
VSAQSINVTFCRSLLGSVMADVRKHTTAEQRRVVWTYHFMRDHWEFHGPGGFYWHGSADGGYDARAKGWAAYLRSKGVEGYADEEEAVS